MSRTAIRTGPEMTEAWTRAPRATPAAWAGLPLACRHLALDLWIRSTAHAPDIGQIEYVGDLRAYICGLVGCADRAERTAVSRRLGVLLEAGVATDDGRRLLLGLTRSVHAPSTRSTRTQHTVDTRPVQSTSTKSAESLYSQNTERKKEREKEREREETESEEQNSGVTAPLDCLILREREREHTHERAHTPEHALPREREKSPGGMNLRSEADCADNDPLPPVRTLHDSEPHLQMLHRASGDSERVWEALSRGYTAARGVPMSPTRKRSRDAINASRGLLEASKALCESLRESCPSADPYVALAIVARAYCTQGDEWCRTRDYPWQHLLDRWGVYAVHVHAWASDPAWSIRPTREEEREVASAEELRVLAAQQMAQWEARREARRAGSGVLS